MVLMTAAEVDMEKEKDTKRKSTETDMANPSNTKKQKKSASSLLLKKSAIAESGESLMLRKKSTTAGSGESLMLVKKRTAAESDESKTIDNSEPAGAAETAVEQRADGDRKSKTVPKRAGKKGEGELSPRGKQWNAVQKFCLKLHKVSIIWQDDLPQYKKFKVIAGKTAKRRRFCNNLCNGAIDDRDNFDTEWGHIDKNRFHMFEFLRQIQKLEESFKKTCLQFTDKKELDTIRRAKINLKRALKVDPVLEYVEQIAPNPNECGSVDWTKSEIHRIMFIYRLKKYYKPNMTWAKLTTFFNCRSVSAVRNKFKECVAGACAKPLTHFNLPKNKGKADTQDTKKPVQTRKKTKKTKK